MNLSAVFEFLKAFRKSLGFKGTVSFIKTMNAAGKSYEETLKKSKKAVYICFNGCRCNHINVRAI